MAHGYKAGDKYSKSSDTVKDLGVSSQESVDHRMKLRGEVKNRPTLAKTSVSSDRGKFTCK